MLMCALFLPIAHETAGAARIRHSLRPLFSRGRRISYNSGASCRENAMLRPAVIACDKRVAFAQGSPCDEAIHPSVMPRDGLLRFARNDGQAMTTLLRRLSGLAEHPCRRRETARRAVRHF